MALTGLLGFTALVRLQPTHRSVWTPLFENIETKLPTNSFYILEF